MVVHNIEDKASFDTSVVQGGLDKLIVVDCFATWCGPCKTIAPVLVKFSDQFKNVDFYKVDVDQLPDVAQQLGVRAMPTFVFYKNGEKVADVVGANPQAILAAIEGNQ